MTHKDDAQRLRSSVHWRNSHGAVTQPWQIPTTSPHTSYMYILMCIIGKHSMNRYVFIFTVFTACIPKILMTMTRNLFCTISCVVLVNGCDVQCVCKTSTSSGFAIACISAWYPKISGKMEGTRNGWTSSPSMDETTVTDDVTSSTWRPCEGCFGDSIERNAQECEFFYQRNAWLVACRLSTGMNDCISPIQSPAPSLKNSKQERHFF